MTFDVEFEEVTNQFCAEFDTVVHVSDANLGTKTITANDTYYAEDDGYDGYSEVTVNVSGGGGTLETITKTYTPTTAQQTEQITPSSGYDGIAEVDVTVDAMPTGTEGTPTATKGAVSNHSVNVTPSVTNVAGYIAGGTKTGTAVTVSASELVSGTKSITANGTGIDVTNYASADVNVPNSYSAGDEGKVVDNGALVAQTAHADVTPTTSDQTIDTTLNNSLKVKGDADLVAANIKKDVEIFGVTGSYEGGGGGYDIEDIAIRNYTGAISLSGNTIREYAFAQSGISSINAPNVTSLGNYAFYKSSVASAIFSSLSGQLPEGTFREAEIVEITPTSFPLITRLALYAFAYSSTLTSAVIPNLGNNDTNANGNSIFNGCSNLEVADLGNIYNIPNNTFTNCSKLGVVVLRRNQVLTMGNINAFQNTPYRTNGNTKVIYVPQSQVSSYQTASNWSQLYAANNNVFQPIEGSYYATHYADGTLIPT